MRYYYAVITFDNKFTAEKIYDDFDGMEIELTGNKLDLRVMPEDTLIPKEPEETCYEINE